MKLDKIGLLGQMHHAGGTRQSRDNVGHGRAAYCKHGFLRYNVTVSKETTLAALAQAQRSIGLSPRGCMIFDCRKGRRSAATNAETYIDSD